MTESDEILADFDCSIRAVRQRRIVEHLDLAIAGRRVDWALLARLCRDELAVSAAEALTTPDGALFERRATVVNHLWQLHDKARSRALSEAA